VNQRLGQKKPLATKTRHHSEVGGDLFGLVVLIVFLSIFALSGCRDSFMKQSTADKTSAIVTLSSDIDAAGNITAAFDPNSQHTQVLELNSGSLAGAAVAIPPGSLAIPLAVVVGEGESLATSSFSQQIGLTDNTIAASGPSVSFIPSENVVATSPLTLSIPYGALAFPLADVNTENLVVMFRSIKVENGTTSYLEGVIPRKQVTVSRDKVTFQTTNFGVFQVGVAQKKIEEKITKPAVRAPALMAEVGQPLIGVWQGACEVAGLLPDRDSVQVPDGFFTSSTRTGLALADATGGGGQTDGSTTGGQTDGSTTGGLTDGSTTGGLTDGSTTGEIKDDDGCRSIVVSIAIDRIKADSSFTGGSTLLSFTGDDPRPFGYLPAASRLTDPQILGSSTTDGFPEGQASADLILPSGCHFVENRNLSSSINLHKDDFLRPDNNGVCRLDLSHRVAEIQCADTSSSDLAVDNVSDSSTNGHSIDMGREGDRWFGRVYGMRYWKRETLGINRGEMFQTLEYFKDNACSALVSSKTEVLAYELPKVDVSETIPVDVRSLKASGRILAEDWFKSTDRRERYIGSCGVSDWQLKEGRDLPSGKSCFVSRKTSPRLQIRDNVLHLCGASKNALEERPRNCSSAFMKFKRVRATAN
jgi:hypothetical protein